MTFGKKRAGIFAFAAALVAAVVALVLLPKEHAGAAAAEKNRAIGEVNNLVAFVRFRGEEEFVDEEYLAAMNAMYNDDPCSVHAYFDEVSLGSLSLSARFLAAEGQPVASVEVSHSRDYYEPYGAANPNGYRREQQGGKENIDGVCREQELVREVIRALEIPENVQLDNDGDGKVDSLTLIVNGKASEDWADLLWPHMTSLFEFTTFERSKYYVPKDYFTEENPVPTEDGLTLGNGLKFESYDLLFSETLYDPAAGDLGDVGVVCHELMHVLGAPDYYSYESNKKNYESVGELDIMAGTQRMPQFPLSYVRRKMGWLEEEKNIPSVFSGGTYTLYPVTAADHKIKAFRIRLPDFAETGEYFMIEARSNEGEGFDSGLSSSGLVIYRVDTNSVERGNMYGEDEVYVYRVRQKGLNPKGNFTSSTANVGGTVVKSSYAIFGKKQADGTLVRSFGREGTDKCYGDVYPDLLYYAGTAENSKSRGKNSGIAVEDIAVNDDGSVTFVLNINGDKGETGDRAAAPMRGYPACYELSDTSVTYKFAATEYNVTAYFLVTEADRVFGTPSEVFYIASAALEGGGTADGVIGVQSVLLGVPLFEYRLTVDGLQPGRRYKCYTLLVLDNMLASAFFASDDLTAQNAGAPSVIHSTVRPPLAFASPPRLVSVANSVATLSVRTDVADVWCYYLALPSGSREPTLEEIMLGRSVTAETEAAGAVPLSPSVAQSISVEFSGNGRYDVYVAAMDGTGAVSEIVRVAVNADGSGKASGITCTSCARSGGAGALFPFTALAVAAALLLRRR